MKYHRSVLEAKLYLGNNLVCSIASEPIQNSEEYINQREEEVKQDCESKAFVRLAEKIKKRFPRLPIIITVDGLYVCQKAIQTCIDYGWDYIIRYKEAKHIPAVADAAKEGASKAIDFIRVHQKGTIIVGGVLIVGGAVAGTVGYVAHRKQRKLDRQFGLALQEYLDSARIGTLNIDILNTLINSIDAIEKNNPKKSINLNISAAQFSDLINCIFDFTKRLAEANNINTHSINRPKYFNKKTSDDLKYYLNM